MFPVIAVAIASLGTVGALNALLAGRQTSSRIERRLRGVVEVLSKSNFPLSDAVLRQMRELSSAEFVLYDESGVALASSFAAAPAVLPPAAPTRETTDLKLGSPLQVEGRWYFHAVAVLPARDVGQSAQLLHVMFPVEEYQRNWREAFMPPLVVGVVTIAVVAIVARLIGGRLSRATGQLENDVMRIAKGDFAPAQLPTTDDEIRDLAIAVNRTAEMLADYEQQVRRTEQMRTVSLLGAGLAHEMRNAATGCRMALDLHAEKCGAQNGDESLFVAKRQLRLMESQLQRFLRAGKPLDDAEKREISLTALVDDLISLVRPSARHARVKLAWTPPDHDILVLADQEALGQVVLNLLINAVEAVQQNGDDLPRVIDVSLRKLEDGTAEFGVCDTGPGPKNSLESALFDPFVTSKAEGVGLGLAVAREVVEAHQGSIDWSRTDGRTSFRVVIPMR
ncbi:Sporulation kinase E [Lacipirellula limnantheis]|uniref:histidine kinase n=2 Tax=Lacipirellula limnantheis TaxID=2528024 RepID=A0A517U0G2_9BACT|nr:Sporulation kinase E [Lacipirellula limnantheis]